MLLKNSHHTLPLKSNIRRIAVIGPAADDPDTMLGNYYGTPSKIVTPLDGVRQQFGDKANVRFSIGSTFTEYSDALLPAEMLTPLESAYAAARAAARWSARGILRERQFRGHAGSVARGTARVFQLGHERPGHRLENSARSTFRRAGRGRCACRTPENLRSASCACAATTAFRRARPRRASIWTIRSFWTRVRRCSAAGFPPRRQ